MDKEKLRELGEKLDVSGKDVRSMRFAKLKEYWFYPFTGICAFLVSILRARHYAKDNEILTSRDTGKEYPYSSSRAEGARFSSLFLFGLVAATGPIAALYRTRGMERPRKMRILLFATVIAIVAVVISYMTFTRFHEHFRPVEYYSGAIAYGVSSREMDLFGG
jgi:hypothetical protein